MQMMDSPTKPAVGVHAFAAGELDSAASPSSAIAIMPAAGGAGHAAMQVKRGTPLGDLLMAATGLDGVMAVAK